MFKNKTALFYCSKMLIMQCMNDMIHIPILTTRHYFIISRFVVAIKKNPTIFILIIIKYSMIDRSTFYRKSRLRV